IFVAAGWIIYEAVGKLRHPDPLETVGWGVGVMLLSSVVNIFVSRQLFKVGEETDSIALKADAWHLRTDVYTSAGVMVGLGLIWLGSILWPGTALHWIDPVAAIAVALLIIKAAYDLTRDSARDLLDAKLPEEEDEWIRTFIANHEGVARGTHDFRTRKSGAHRFVEFHVLVPSGMTVVQAHDDTAALSDGIKKKFPGAAVTIHIDPCRLDCPPDCVDSCFLTEEERDALREP
ncbi:MAG: cation transporter, partial [Deltaproteobacteria bacterium]|nr:cation transporter [Deltaproteobacteria bacterium]